MKLRQPFEKRLKTFILVSCQEFTSVMKSKEFHMKIPSKLIILRAIDRNRKLVYKCMSSN